jgi:PAT family beta-lactamase induction signal transducer AmpG
LSRRLAPIWLMGLSNSTFGLFCGFLSFSLQQLLASAHVPEAAIASITAAAVSPFFWGFVFSPMLDVRFSRRFYATLFAATAAISLAVAILNLHNLAILEAAMIAGTLSAGLANNALGGWLSTVIPTSAEAKLSAWFTIANIGASGVMVILATETIHHAPLRLAAILLAALVFAPTLIFLWIPAPGPDRQLARESFLGFFAAILALVRRRDVLIALALFLAPSATFTLTNVLGGMGADFHASDRMVSMIGGFGVALAGIGGSLLFPMIAARTTRRIGLRPLYLGIGIVGSVFTLGLIFLPHTPTTFAVATIGEYAFQSLAFTAVVAIQLETIGHNNPLAATTFSLLAAASNLPLIYMQIFDGRAYASHGVTGAYLADALICIAACLVLGLLLVLLRKLSPRKQQEPA